MPTMSVSSRLGLSRPRLLDRYIVREMLAPSAIGLLVFTFVLLIDQIPRLLAVLVARSADLATILRVFLNLLPSILAVTLPMAFLLGVLLAFGRLASDSEIVALRAVGVSPLRLLAPVMMLAAAMTALTFYINAVALPRANQSYRELVFSLVVSKARTDVKARTFTDSLLPGRMMLYVQDIEPDTGRWRNLLIHDTRDLREPKLILAKTGELVVDRDRQIVRIELGPGSQHSFFPSDPREYNRTAFASMGWDLPVDEFFPDRKKLLLSKGDREMTLGELGDRIAQMRSAGQARKEWGRFSVEWHKKFAIPAACLVFGLLGLALSLGSKKEARSSAFALSIGVIFVYYVLIRLGEQAGDTGMISPFAVDVGRQPRPGGGRAGASLAEPPRGRLRPAGPRALPRLRAEGPPATRGPARPGRAQRRARRAEKAGRRGPHPEAHPALPLPPRPLHRRAPGPANVALVLVAFMSIFFLGEFMDLIDDIQQHSVKGKVLVRYYAFHVWWIGFTVAPVAVLIGVLVTLGLLARHNEITAMKAGGISVYRAAGPVLGMGLLASLLLYGMQEWMLPVTNKAAALDFNVIKGRPAQASDQFDRRWVLASDERFYNFDYIVERSAPRASGVAEPATGGEFSVYGFSIYDVDPKTWELRERLFASRAAWNGATRTYELERGWRRTTGERSSFRPFAAERVRVIGRDPGGEIEPPSYFRREEKPSDTMGFAELTAYIRSLETRGFDVAKLRVQLHRKLAFPLVGFIMTLLAVPFSFIVARRGALYGIGIAIVIAIVYWAVLGALRGPRQQRAPPPGARGLGPEPRLRRHRPLPDPHARDLTPVVPWGFVSPGDEESADPPAGPSGPVQPVSFRMTGPTPLPVDPDVGDPDRAPGAGLDGRAVQDEDHRARLAGVEPAVAPPVDGAEAPERDLHLAPLGGGPHRGEPPLEPLVGGRRVDVAHLHPRPVLAVRPDAEAQPRPGGEVARLPVHERAPRERLRRRRLAEPEGELQGVAAVGPRTGCGDRWVHPRGRVELRIEDGRSVERRQRAALPWRGWGARPGGGPPAGLARLLVVDVDRVRDHPGHGPARHASLHAIDPGAGKRELERPRPLPHRHSVAEENDAGSRGHPPARDGAGSVGPGHVVAHRPALSRFRARW